MTGHSDIEICLFIGRWAMNRVLHVILILFISAESFAAFHAENQTAIGLGISAPDWTSTTILSNGLTVKNPVGVLYQRQNSARITVEYDQTNRGTSRAGGFEAGYAKDRWGLAAGYRKVDCSGCEGRLTADAAYSLDGAALGISASENNYSAGLLLRPREQHRFGVVVESRASNIDLHSYSFGYSYVQPTFTFTLDASRLSSPGLSSTYISPGFQFRQGVLEISINDLATLDSTSTISDDAIWLGIGYTGDNWNINGYFDYVKKIALVVSFNL